MDEKLERIPMVVIPSAPGDGKTHLLWSLVSRERVDTEVDSAVRSFLAGEKGKNVGVANVDAGKSAVSISLGEKQRNDFVSLFKNSVRVSVTFNHQTQVQVGEHGGSVLGTRMLYSHFCRGDWETFRTQMDRIVVDGNLAGSAQTA